MGYLHRLANVGTHLGHGTTGLLHLGFGCCLLLAAGTIDGHVVLALGSLGLSLGSGVLGIGLVALLFAQHALVKQALDALVRLFMNLQCSLGLLPQLVGTLHLFLPGSVLGHLTHGRCSLHYSTGLLTLGPHFGRIQYGQRVTHVHIVALVLTNLHDAPWHLTRHTVLRDVHLSLNILGLVAQCKKADNGHCDDHYHETQYGQQYIRMLRFLTHNAVSYLKFTISLNH